MSMPIDNGKEYFVKDFYKRTLNILRSTQCEYDVALLINSMVGLLVVPKERYFHSMCVPDNYVDPDILKQIRSTFKSNPDITLTQLLRRLRNSVCHGNMEIKAEKSNYIGEQPKIGSIVFNDRDGTSAEITIDLLKNFLISFVVNVCSNAEEKVVTDI